MTWKKIPCNKKIGDVVYVAFDSDVLKIRVTENIKEDSMIGGYTHWWDAEINLENMRKLWMIKKFY